MKVKFRLVIFLFFSVINSAGAQYHFVESTVWFKNGDSTRGWIDKNGLLLNSNRIRFKIITNDNESIFYTAAEVNAFKFDGGSKYTGYEGMIDSAHFFFVAKDTLINPVAIEDTMFLQPVTVGKATLLYGKDHRDLIHFFIQKESNLPEELHYYTIQWMKKGTNVGIFEKTSYYQFERKKFKQQLLAAFSDDQKLYKKLADSELHFTSNNLKKWFREYNKDSKNYTLEIKRKIRENVVPVSRI